MTTAEASRFPVAWLDLREPADAAARAPELVDALRAHLTAAGWPDPLVVRDLGSGTGSMARWLAPRLPGRQRWILHDHDPDLLAHATAHKPLVAADGAAVTVELRPRDVTRLRSGDLAGTSLLTASALLDLLTADEVDRIARACLRVGCPALFTLSVTGAVELTPADPLDAELRAAFNDHQRRVTGGRRLLGPDAPEVAAAAFERRGARVTGHASPWRLGPDRPRLLARWLRGWVGAACEQRPDLAGAADAYLRRRLAECAAGALRVVVDHRDLLVVPPGGAA